ncbi:TBC1 domain family member 4 isoform X1 [Chiloscyllium plagiosum]|uniref:TBC1 domain family member 4 isoform X1 n=1 Tax=Chiloscyllium plagiosum TaxID=36176 RepID=UPI001CB810A1|nr:TBC1 domain family member 4 isoform X1 [Chiloscyllium plagiosum]
MEEDSGNSQGQPEEKSKPEKQFTLWYMGCSTLDRRTTLPMLPWLMAEVRRRCEKQELGSSLAAREVQLSLVPPLIRCVPKATSSNPSVFIFEHKAQHVTRFIHNSHDLTYFAYLIRTQPDNPESEMACHVFRATDPNQVPDVISSIRQVSKATLKGDTKSRQDSEDAFYNSQKYEVLYCGKVVVTHKKAPSTLIDDCIEKFTQHQLEKERLRLLNEKPMVDVTADQEEDDASGDSALPHDVADEATVSTKLPSASNSQSDLLGLGFRSALTEPSPEDTALEEEHAEFRSRCNSVASIRLKRVPDLGTKLPTRRRHASAPSHVQPSDTEKNRTMLFQVGRFEINLISPDTKTVVLEKNFKNISSCSQGIKHVDHFGFICRESVEQGLNQYVCYVFQCANESLVDEVMLTLKQAFSTAAALQNAKTQIKLCEACPMHYLHKLCERIEGLYPPRAKLAIQRHVSLLSDNEQADIFERVQKMKPADDQDENELVILILRQICENKQKTHAHLGESPMPVPNNMIPEHSASTGRFKLDVLKNKAKKSLTSSLENIFSRGAKMRGRLGSMDSFERCNSLASDASRDASPGESPPNSPPVSPRASPISSLGQLFTEDDPDSPQFRRRAHTFSHPPSSSKRRISFPNEKLPHGRSPIFRQQSEIIRSSPINIVRSNRSNSESESTSSSLPSSLSVPTFLKPFYTNTSRLLQQSESGTSKSDGEGRRRAFSGCSTESLSGGGGVLTPRRISWRQRIFLRVASPMNKSSAAMQQKGTLEDHLESIELPPLSPLTPAVEEDPLASLLMADDAPVGEKKKRSSEELRIMWRKAICQQILLLRMEKENQRLEASRDELQTRKVKLDYEEFVLCQKEVSTVWDKMLTTPGRAKVKVDMEKVHAALSQGVPKARRGEIWQFLAEQYRLRHRLPEKQQPADISYKELLKQLTTQQHAILVDLGRTFPTHAYFSAQLGAGQLSLFNLLKAYSLLDKEVGYCQGISFVAGVLLLHTSEEQAFEMLKFLMYDLGFRKQYRPDMMSLQIQMYQLSRLLHDYHRDLYNHLEDNEVSPSLYAAPWFLTFFASQFPLGFVARVFDIMFLQGTEVIFKVALSLMSSHEALILKCDSFETIVDFIKSTIPNLSHTQMEKTIVQVFEMDISKQLHAYEVEYHVLQDEMVENSLPNDDGDRLEKLERANCQLKRQNMELLEKLQATRFKIQNLEASIESILIRENKMKLLIRTMEQEKQSHLKTIEHMRKYLPQDVLNDGEFVVRKNSGIFSSRRPEAMDEELDGSKVKIGNNKP